MTMSDDQKKKIDELQDLKKKEQEMDEVNKGLAKRDVIDTMIGQWALRSKSTKCGDKSYMNGNPYLIKRVTAYHFQIESFHGSTTWLSKETFGKDWVEIPMEKDERR